MPRVLGISQILNKEYKELPFEGDWKALIGVPSDPFTMLVFGHPKNGKTTLLMRFSKYLSQFGKVFYSSIEEGDTKTTKDVFIRENMKDIEATGKFMLGDGFFFNDLVEYLKGSNRGRFIVIDSRDYMKLTAQQYIKLVTLFPRKSFIIVCWEQAGKPAGKFAKDIEYMVDTVVHVKDFKAKATGRFGVGEYTIWNKKPNRGDQLKLHVA